MQENPSTQLIITGVRDQAPDIRSFDLRPGGISENAVVNYIPGQVAVIRVDDEPPAYFAFASAPADSDLEVLVKKKVGASNVLYEMSVGDSIELISIAGHGFALDSVAGRDLVFVAMGTGVAPLRSALRHVLQRKSGYGQLMVLYGARNPRDFCYREEMDEWALNGVELRQVISRPDGHDWSGPTGYVQSLLDNVLPNLNSPVAMICGSLEMIDQTRERLLKMGFKPDDVLTNY